MTLPDELFSVGVRQPEARKASGNVLGRVTEIQVLLAAGRGEVVPHATDERVWVREVLARALGRAVRDKHEAETERYRRALELFDSAFSAGPRAAPRARG